MGGLIAAFEEIPSPGLSCQDTQGPHVCFNQGEGNEVLQYPFRGFGDFRIHDRRQGVVGLNAGEPSGFHRCELLEAGWRARGIRDVIT